MWVCYPTSLYLKIDVKQFIRCLYFCAILNCTQNQQRECFYRLSDIFICSVPSILSYQWGMIIIKWWVPSILPDSCWLNNSANQATVKQQKLQATKYCLLTSYPYLSQESELLEYVDNEELPPILCDLLDKVQTNVFYSGCVIMEVRDYRRTTDMSYDTKYVLLKPTAHVSGKNSGLFNRCKLWSQNSIRKGTVMYIAKDIVEVIISYIHKQPMK